MILVGVFLFMLNINIVVYIGGFIGGLLIILIGYYYKVNCNIFWILLIGMFVIFIVF